MNVPLIGRDAELGYITSLFAESPTAAVVVAGSAGVGKTRLAAEVAAAATATGRPVAHVIATPGGAAIPFGVFAPLLPDLVTLGNHSAELIQSFCRAIADRAEDGQSLLLVVDDAQFLDPGSASLVHQLVHTRTCGLIATLRTSHVPPESIVSLWKDGLGQRVEIQALSRRETDDLVASYLGGAVAGSALRWLWDVSEGNPLFVRELVIGARETESAHVRDGIWFLRLPLPAPSRLQDLIAFRLATVTRETAEVVELLAVGEPLGYCELAKIAGQDAVEDAEHRGLIAIQDERGRTQVRLSHPLYREAVRHRMPRARLRRLSATLAEASEATGARRRDDIMRIARWRLDAGATDNPELFERAGREARVVGDCRLAARFARAAVNAGGGITAGLFLGETEYAAGRLQEAETVLAELVSLCRTDEERSLVANARAYNLGILMGDEQAAAAVLEEALSSVQEPGVRHRLLVRQAIHDAYAGRPAYALAKTGELITSPNEIILGRGYYAHALALALLGRTEEAAATASQSFERRRRSLTEQRDGSAALDFQPPEAHLVGAIMAHVFGGRLADAEADARLGYELAVEGDNKDCQATLCLLRGWVKVETGQLSAAARLFREGAAIHREVSDVGGLRWCVAGVALAEAMAGQAAAATEAVDELSTLDHWMIALDPGLVDRCRGWVLIASGELSVARTQFREAADRARERELFGGEAILLHDLVRLGDGKAVAPRLNELTELVDGDLVPAFAAHAAGRIAGDPAGLEAVAASFEKIGALQLAAETAHEAAGAHRAGGNSRRAAEMAREFTRLSNLCGSVRSPLVAGFDADARLTRREREIAMLAAPGLSSKTIAERLHLSARTVDNHLLSAYSKLGVSNRGALAAALRDAGHAS